MRQWLPASHVVWTLIKAVQLLDTSALHARCHTGGAGRAGYDPDMMLTLLVYAYARGVTSSRQIERLCWDDVAFRVICAEDVPDHTTIWRFADTAPEVVQALFAEVLQLCAKAGMLRLDTITLDGTKMVANASMKANRGEEQIRAELEQRAQAAVAKHLATDAQENALFGVDARGDELPEELADPRRRGPRLERALADLARERQAEQAERAAKAQERLRRVREGNATNSPLNETRVVEAEMRLEQAIAAQRAKIEEYERRSTQKTAETGKGLQGEPPRPVEEHFAVARARAALAKALARHVEWTKKQEQQQPAQRNTTDPDSRLMPTRSGFVQGYNAQNVVTEDLFILATDVTQDTGDAEQWVPMMGEAEKAAGLVTTVHSEQARAAGEPCTCPPDRDDDKDPPPPSTGSEHAAQEKPACPVHPNGIGISVGDAGYLSRRNCTTPGPDRLIATGKRRHVEKAARTATPEPTKPQPHNQADEPGPVKAMGPDSQADEPDPVEAMAERLRTPEAMAIYRRRGHIAETPHGHIKHNMGIRTFARRGLRRVRAEWTLICAVYNIDRLLRNLRAAGHSLPGVA
jgi:transposase